MNFCCCHRFCYVVILEHLLDFGLNFSCLGEHTLLFKGTHELDPTWRLNRKRNTLEKGDTLVKDPSCT